MKTTLAILAGAALLSGAPFAALAHGGGYHGGHHGGGYYRGGYRGYYGGWALAYPGAYAYPAYAYPTYAYPSVVYAHPVYRAAPPARCGHWTWDPRTAQYVWDATGC